jgi:hypothetical protein
MCAKIKLTLGLYAIIDDADFEMLNNYKWYAKKGRKTFYAARRHGHKVQQMHRLILNAKAGQQVDHIDHEGLNNQRNNLRLCTEAQNSCNRKGRGVSPYLGVSKHRDKYQAQITKGGINLALGVYNTEEAAARAYDTAAKEIHGIYANLNFK